MLWEVVAVASRNVSVAPWKQFLHENDIKVVLGLHFHSLIDENESRLASGGHPGQDHKRSGMTLSRDVAATLVGLLDRWGSNSIVLAVEGLPDSKQLLIGEEDIKFVHHLETLQHL
uniref:Uncharacterized protein n=1 Tax=Caenorhabditis japonica TaxID=281687 RepID=A0A8R1EI64_CAEJA